MPFLGLADGLLAESSDDGDVVELETADPAAIARKRSFQKTAITKSENVSKRTRVAHGQSTEVAISAETRVREFPDEPLKSDCGQVSVPGMPYNIVREEE